MFTIGKCIKISLALAFMSVYDSIFGNIIENLSADFLESILLVS